MMNDEFFKNTEPVYNAVPFLNVAQYYQQSKNIYLFYNLVPGIIFIYFLIDWLKKIANVHWDDAGIYINKNLCAWQDIKDIKIDYNAYLQHFSTTAIIIETRDAAFTIYNFAYSNYPAMMQYIQAFHPQLLPGKLLCHPGLQIATYTKLILA